MKATINQVQALLTAIGADVQLVENESESDFDQTAAMQAIDGNRGEILKPKYKDELKKWAAGETGAKLRKRLADTMGVSQKDLEGLADDEAIAKALEHYTGTMGGDKKALQEEITRMLETHKNALDTLKNEHTTALQAAQERYVDRDITGALEAILKDAPLLNSADRRTLANDLKAELKGKYHVAYDEKLKAINLFQKDKPDVPVYNENETEKAKISDLAKDFFTPRGLWQTDTRHVKPTDAMNGNSQQYQPSNNGNNNNGQQQAQPSRMDKFLADAGV